MKKIKININRPKPESGKIAEQMNFDELLRSYRDQKKGTRFTRPFLLFFAATAILVAALFALKNDKVTPQNMQAAIVPTVVAAADSTPKSVIKPLIPGMKINESEFSCSSEGDTLYTPSGASIIVPARAFIDDHGKTVNDSVTIVFREYNDPLDFACSGIPMTYDSAGRTWIFESSGMCEIQGYCKGRPVHINMSTPLTINMNSKFGMNDPNLYRMDTSTGKWTYIGKPTVVADKKIRQKETRQLKSELIVEADMDAKRPKDLQVLTAESRKLNAQIKILENEIAALQSPAKPRKVSSTKHHFTIDVKQDEFPELGPYREVIFEVDETDQEFKEAYYNIRWNDMKLEEIEAGRKYKLILERNAGSSGTDEPVGKQGRKGSKRTKEKLTDIDFPEKESGKNVAAAPERLVLVVSPVYSEENFEKEMKAFNEKYKEYQDKMAEKQAKLEELRKKREEENLARLKRQEEARKFAEEAYKHRNSEINYGNIRVSFAADRFGIYNSDFPVSYRHPAKVVASFEHPDGSKMYVDIMYHLQFSRNSMMSWYYNGCCNNEMKYDTDAENMLFTVLPDKRVAWLDREEFKKLPQSGSADIKMKESDKSFKTIADMKKHIGL